MIDSLHEKYIQYGRKIKSSEITKNINSIAFYDSIVVFEKRYRNASSAIQRGKETIIPYVDPTLKKLTILMQIKKKLYSIYMRKQN
jgi:hypothetical protein